MDWLPDFGEREMTRILVVYGTTDGHTAKVARFIGSELGTRGASVDVVDAAMANPDPAGYSGVIVAASIHAAGYQHSVVRWARAHAEALRTVPSVFVSVCLAVLQKDVAVIRDLDRIVGGFEEATGWEPAQVKLVAGALLYTKYGFLKRMTMRRIVAKAGGDTDTSRDYEYTDWKDLKAFAGDFFERCTEGPRGRYDSHDALRGCLSATIDD